MSWLALSPLQTAFLWLAVSAFALWLYLHQRPTRRKVSTLRFWADLPPSVYRRRRWLREPWAFLAQVLFLLFVILALANPRWGSVTESRRVAIVLDTSIWSQVQRQGEPPWIDLIRQDAYRLLNTLPATDEVLLLRAEPDALPILPFTHDRAEQRRAVAQTRASSSVADIPRALEAGRAALTGSRLGLLVYIGPGMLDEQQAGALEQLRQVWEPGDGSGDHPRFLVRIVGGEKPIENRGISRLALQRDATKPDRWHLLTQLKNYSESKAAVVLKLSVSGQPLLQRNVSLAPGQVSGLNDDFVAAQGGLLTAEITPADDLRADDRAMVYVPPFWPINIAVFTSRASFENDLRPVLSTNPYLRAQFVRPGAPVNPAADMAIYDAASPPAHATLNSVYFIRGQPGRAAHPIRVTDWNPQHAATRWVRTRDVSVRNAANLNVRSTDTVLASGEGHPEIPLIVAREQDGHKTLLVGFDLHDSNFTQQSAFPLLIAGAVEWLTHPIEDISNSLSAGELGLPGSATRIVSPSGADVPFAQNGSGVHLLALDAGLYRVIGANRSTTFAVNAPPLLPSRRITPTAGESASVMEEPVPYQGTYLWQCFVLLAMAALWVEWWLFYSHRVNRRAVLIQHEELQGGAPTPDKDALKDDALDPNFIT
jgi:Ca-activated chloride channel family protein